MTYVSFPVDSLSHIIVIEASIIEAACTIYIIELQYEGKRGLAKFVKQ